MRLGRCATTEAGVGKRTPEGSTTKAFEFLHLSGADKAAEQCVGRRVHDFMHRCICARTRHVGMCVYIDISARKCANEISAIDAEDGLDFLEELLVGLRARLAWIFVGGLTAKLGIGGGVGGGESSTLVNGQARGVLDDDAEFIRKCRCSAQFVGLHDVGKHGVSTLFASHRNQTSARIEHRVANGDDFGHWRGFIEIARRSLGHRTRDANAQLARNSPRIRSERTAHCGDLKQLATNEDVSRRSIARAQDRVSGCAKRIDAAGALGAERVSEPFPKLVLVTAIAVPLLDIPSVNALHCGPFGVGDRKASVTPSDHLGETHIRPIVGE